MAGSLLRCHERRRRGHEPTTPALVDFHRCDAKLAATIRHLDESY
ncbi:hypothetical protein RTCIAT899_PB00590 (plasmid) [Rhizobium tropici CIAT 899]|nr:hypothetical protein RTCIAT899_PB00590 [Rhizobium tropici CIAT 899]